MKAFLMIGFIFFFSLNGECASLESLHNRDWFSYHDYISYLVKFRFTTKDQVRRNIEEYEHAITDFSQICHNPKIRPFYKKQKLLKIIQYAQKVVQVQMPYGLDFFAHDFNQQIDEARNYVQSGNCDQFKGHLIWNKELKMIKQELLKGLVK